MEAAALVRPVRDVLAQQLGQVRGAQWGVHLAWPVDAELQTGLGLDSIELVEAAEQVSRMFLLERPGWEDYLLRDRSLHGWASVAAAVLADEGELRFASSGSQGERRDVVHALAALDDEARGFAATIGPRATVRVAVPTHHIYGFIFGVLLPRALDAPAVDYCGRLPSTLARETQPRDVVVAHPLVWQALASGGARWPEDVTGVTSTAPCPPDVIDRLRANGLARMIEVYGSSETAGIGWRDAPSRPFALFPRWRLDVADAPVLRDVSGRAHPLPDRVEVVDGGLRPVARLDAAVQVAGHNVHPARVAARLEAHPDVVAAAVRLDTASGRLKAFLVLTAGAALDPEALRAWCRRELPDAALPARFATGASLPRNVMGKAADWD
ncbi:AMP-binding enzyme [Lysobacter xanthus]